MKKECHRCYKIFLYSIQDGHVKKKIKKISSTYEVSPAMEFTVPKLSPFDCCTDTICDLKGSINYLCPPDKQFILVAISF